MLKAVKRYLIITAILIAASVTLALLKNNTYISEYIFSRGFSRWYIYIIGSVTSLLSFSLYEILLTAIIIWFLILLIKLIGNLRKKDFGKAAKKVFTIVAVVLSLVLMYNITASFAYYRYPLEIELYDEKPDKTEVIAIAQYFMEDFNTLSEKFDRDNEGNIIPPYTFSELSDKLKTEFKRLGGGYFSSYIPSAKPMIFSEIMSYMGFSGVFMSITGEPNINVNIPPMDLPMVIAHEMAHSAGIMRENEANLTAYYLLLTSSDNYLRYSGYCSTFGQMTAAVYYLNSSEEYQALIDGYNPKILKEYQNASKFWLKYQSFFNNISDFINDVYLKISGIIEGTKSYENPFDVIDTGETDENGDVIYDIVYSNVQKIYFKIYTAVKYNA